MTWTPAFAAALADRYRLERELGQGGMATVYLARDLRHQRPVAVKVLRPELAAAIGKERFLAEIATMAGLHHPNILPLFDSGEADGLLYFVMPLVEGESLRDRITRERRLPIDDAVRIAGEVAAALDYAHRHGIIHRDIKPENILLQDGHALVADFGIALGKTTGDVRLTATGTSLGTPQYMSPEQALGERALDARSDIYALGVTLYEMLTGAPPFTGPTPQAIAAKLLTEKPVPPSRLRREIPASVEAAILTAMAKEPDRRFATAAEFQSALGADRARRRGRMPLRLRNPFVIGGVTLAAVAIWYGLHGGTPAAYASGRVIAALPFTAAGDSAAAASLADNLPTEILDGLANVRGLIVRPMPPDDRFRRGMKPQTAAAELNANVILTGTVIRQGDSVRISVRMYDARRDAVVGTISLTTSASDIFALEDSVSAAVIARFRLSGDLSRDLATNRRNRTPNPAAHDTLMLARLYTEQRTCDALARAVNLYGVAVKLDSNYAEAWSGLAETENLRGAFWCGPAEETFGAARAAAGRALLLDSTLAEAHTSLGFLHVLTDRDWPAAASEFTRSVELDANNADTWLFRTWYYMGTGHLDSARASVRRARELSPGSSIIRTRLATVLEDSDSLEASLAEVRDIIRVEPGFVPAKPQLAEVLALMGRCDQLQPAPVVRAAQLDYLAALVSCHKAPDAATLVRQLAPADSGAVHAFSVALVYAALGDRATMYDWLDRAAATNNWQLFQLAVYPAFKPYRAEPRFQAILRRVNVAPAR